MIRKGQMLSSEGTEKSGQIWWLFDETTPARPDASVIDFWSFDEFVLESTAASDFVSRHGESAEAASWLWDTSSGSAQTKIPELYVDIYLPLDGYRPYARENPFVVPPFQPVRQREQHQKRARWLVALLDVPEPRRRKRFIRFFEELFLEFNHQNTFRVLSGYAIDQDLGDARLFVDACRFRMNFRFRPDWWGLRRGSSVSFAGDDKSMTWKRAFEITSLFGYDPTAHIDDSWLDDWSTGNGRDFSTFSDYLTERAGLFRSDIWVVPGPNAVQTVFPESRRNIGLPGISLSSRTANLIGLRSPNDEYRPK